MAPIAKDSMAFPVMVDFAVDADQSGSHAAHIHRSLGGSRVVNHLRWRSRADHEACLNNPEVMAAGKPPMDYLETRLVRFD